MCLFLDEASYWAEKLLTDINLPPLLPDADNNFGGSLDLDFRKWWRHVQPTDFLILDTKQPHKTHTNETNKFMQYVF